MTGLESAVRQLTIFVFICKTDLSKPVKQEINGTMILPPLVFPAIFINYTPRAMLQIVVALTDHSRGLNYYHNMFIVQATKPT